MESEVIIPSPVINQVSEPAILPSLPIVVNKTSCPWGKVNAVEAVSFNDVMSEQLAKSLQEAEKLESIPQTVYVDDLGGCGEEINDCSDDYVLAKLLQQEFDKEHDDQLKRVESQYNRNQKIKVSYSKYLHCPENSTSSEDEEERDYFLEQNAKNHWQNFEQAKKTFQSVGKSGVSRQGNVTTTKHDLTMCGRINADRLMKLPSCISTGDGGTFDMKLSNSVYSALKLYSKAEQKRRNRLHDKKEKATTEQALDEKTHLILYKLVNNEILDSISGCISTGKEACVYHAWSGRSEEVKHPEYAIKIFKTTLNEFQNRDEYVSGEYRFKNRFPRQNPRKIIYLWAEKEMRNLSRMKEAGIPCPDVVAHKKHVLLMSFIGKEMLPAPKLKDVDLPFADITIIYEQTVDIMKKMYSLCNLVHADMSEYNLLWYDDKIWVIDVGQSVDLSHPRSKEFLLRDCTNITTFFEKKGVLNIPKPEELLAEICNQPPAACEKVPSAESKEDTLKLEESA